MPQDRQLRMPEGRLRWRACVGGLLLAVAICLVGGRGVGAETPSPPRLNEAELAAAKHLAAGVTIYRDAYGVPHIHGQTDNHVAFGYAFAQAEDLFWQIEDNYILGQGRYCEVHGRTGMNSDLLNRAFEIVPQSKANFARLDANIRDYCSSFTLGLNYYLYTHPQVKPRLIEHFEPWHVLAFGRQVLLELTFRYTRLSNSFLPRSNDLIWSASGSNGWAIAPARTKDGNAMLFVNPHLPSFGFSLMHEAHLKSDEGWSFIGCTMFGSCVPTMGHNEHLGWTLTTNEPDVADVWKMTFDDPENPLRYRWGDGYREASEWKETINVRVGLTVRPQVVKLRKTHFGPIVDELDAQHFLSARVAGVDNTSMLKQQLTLVKSKTLEQFKAGLSMQQFPIMNILYADRDKNIFYLYNGMVPKRDPQFDWSKPVDGADPRTEWQGLHGVDELPQLLNPPDGFVQNCNSSPFTTCDTGNPDRAKFPRYMAEDADDDKRRAKRSRQILSEMKNVTLDDLRVAAFDTTVYWAKEELPKYAARFEKLKESDPKLAERVQPYLEHLLRWDCRVTAESTEATLCEAWYELLYSTNYPAETLLPQFVANPNLEFEMLARAAETLRVRHGDWKIPWGNLFRTQRQPEVIDFRDPKFSDRQPSLPLTAAPGPMGVVFTEYYTPSIRILGILNLTRRYGLIGTSYMAVYEFGDKIKGASVLTYGENGDPTSPNYFDQAKLLSERKLKDDLFEWADVVANCKLVYHPGERPNEQPKP